MAPRSKVEKSEHYKEIVELLLDGQSGRSVSRWLKEEYDEDIGYSAINTFKRNHLDIETEVKTRELLSKKQKQKQKQKQEAILKRAEIESDVEVAKEEAINKLTQALHVLEFFINNHGETIITDLINDDEVKSDSKTNILLKAIKYYLDFYKDDKPEVNITNNQIGNSFDKNKIRKILNEKREGKGNN